jgi:hypothetical protein
LSMSRLELLAMNSILQGLLLATHYLLRLQPEIVFSNERVAGSP